jgi:DNA-directed RNA polymerase specialized sigma24 family protein
MLRMPARDSDVQSQAPGGGLFVTTHWSVVLAARDKTAPGCTQALEILCQTYWYPLYAFVRSSGYSPPDAQDLTQAFFARLLEKDYLRTVGPEKGRFRTFLKFALKRFLTNEWVRLRAGKRGGGHVHLSFDTTFGEARFREDLVDGLNPDSVYDRQWALTLLGKSLERLENEYKTAGKTSEWRHLKPHLMAERGTIPYAEIAAALQTTEGAARVAVHRLRRRFREVFRQVIAETLSAPQEIEEEVRYILQVLSHC